MTRTLLCPFLLLVLVGGAAWGQIPGDQIGVHDLTPAGISPVKGTVSASCLYCHAPHSALAGQPLWNQTLSVNAYSGYGSTTYHQKLIQPAVNTSSKLCLSCHDGTVAPGQTVAFGKMTMSGAMGTGTKFGSDLRNSHPFSMKVPLVDSPEIAPQLFNSSPSTKDPAVKLVKNIARPSRNQNTSASFQLSALSFQ